MLVLLACLAGAPLAPQKQPLPANDGFIYPGRPGSEGVADYFESNAKFKSKRVPPRDLRKESAVAWMPGRWRVARRDFDEAGGASVSEVLAGEATIAITESGGWVQISARFGGRESWMFLGHDSRRWLMHFISRPGHMYPQALYAAEGSPDGRLVFEPVTFTSTSGLTLTDRVVLVREDPARFRVVIEGRIGNGNFVAMDDYLFER